MPFIHAYLEADEQYEIRTSDESAWEGLAALSPIRVLAEQAECDPEHLRRMLKGKVQAIDFDIADRLLCAMSLWDEWYGELAKYYDRVTLSETKTCSHGIEIERHEHFTDYCNTCRRQQEKRAETKHAVAA